MDKPRILCVDDEAQVLEGLQLNLRKRFDVTVATSGAAALEKLAAGLAPVAIMSDMRMPGMDGATFLARARVACPDATRLLLTGHADMTSAISAVNDGQIFRFLTKPCPAPSLLVALEAAVEQHRLVTAERVLLEQTLHGCVKTLTEVLSLTNPVAFGRATRVKRRVTELAEHLQIRDRWQVEVAAMLSQLGAITLPEDTAEKVYYGRQLSPEEHKMVARLPAVTEQLLGPIPRLEEVRAILMAYPMPPWRGAASADPLRARAEDSACLLRVAMDFDTLEAQGSAPEVAIGVLRSRGDRYDSRVLDALDALHGVSRQFVTKELPLSGLRVGMVLVEDLTRNDGMLILAHGVEISASVLERIKNFRIGTIKEPIRVTVRTETTAAVAR